MLREELDTVRARADELDTDPTAGRRSSGGGAKSVDFRQGVMSVTPIDLGSVGAKALRKKIPEALYESGRSTVRVRLPEEAAERFRAVVRAAEAILEVATEPDPH